MPGYNLNQVVPWRAVLFVLRRHLELNIRRYEQACAPGRDGSLNRDSIEAARQALEQSCRTHAALRKFLGYHTEIRAEREAVALLSGALPDRRCQ